MPGRNGYAVSGGWANSAMKVNNQTFPADLTIDTRDASLSEYLAGSSITLQNEFEDKGADEYIIHIATGSTIPASPSNGTGIINGTGNGNYRYGFNGQEKSDELDNGLYTAQFWEYDSRIGRRWNLDPIYNTDISRYAVEGNNPIYYNDPNGDYKHKLQAQWYKLWHGGTVTQCDPKSKGPHAGEWRVGKSGGTGPNGELISKVHYGDEKSSNTDLADITSHPIKTFNQAKNIVNSKASDIWNSTPARILVPDFIPISGNFQTSSGTYVSEDFTITIMLRGKDPGIYFNTTTGAGGVSSAGVDVGCSVGRGYYLGDPRKMSKNILGGWGFSASGGIKPKVGAGGGADVGVDIGFNHGKPETMTIKIDVSVGVGGATPVHGSAGGSNSTEPIPIIKF